MAGDGDGDGQVTGVSFSVSRESVVLFNGADCTGYAHQPFIYPNGNAPVSLDPQVPWWLSVLGAPPLLCEVGSIT